jgi:cytochrome P450
MGLKIIGLAFKVALFLLRKFDRMRGTTSNMTAAEFRLNPYESFHRLRRISPIIRSYANQGWMVTGYEQAQDVLRDGRFSNDIHWDWLFLLSITLRCSVLIRRIIRALENW